MTDLLKETWAFLETESEAKVVPLHSCLSLAQCNSHLSSLEFLLAFVCA